MDLHMLKQLDSDTLVNSAAKTRRRLAVGKTNSTTGPTAEVMARCAENVEGARFRRIAFPDAPPPASPEMFNWKRPNADRIMDAAKRMVCVMKDAFGNITAAPIEAIPVNFRLVCDHCAAGFLNPTRISTAFWRDDKLVVVRNIPAMVCPDCGEEYVDDATVVQLDSLRGRGFMGAEVIDQMAVPVFDFNGAG